MPVSSRQRRDRGVDYDWRLGQRWGLTGFWAGTRVAGGPVAIGAVQKNNVH